MDSKQHFSGRSRNLLLTMCRQEIVMVTETTQNPSVSLLTNLPTISKAAQRTQFDNHYQRHSCIADANVQMTANRNVVISKVLLCSEGGQGTINDPYASHRMQY